ncbi:MAG: peptidoglycan DD-metalloendopeptidase family protein [Pseudomonadota bacterium]
MYSVNRRWLCLLLLLLGGMLSGCGQMQPLGGRSEMIKYTVKPGDTLFSIAWRYGYDHRQVAGWNNIPAPFTIHPGQHIYIIPPYQRNARQAKRAEKQPAATTTRSSTATAKAPATPTTTALPRSAKQQRSKAAVEKKSPNRQSQKISWQWPATGKVITGFAPAKGKKGLDIRGNAGQSVKSAAAGEVVYSGDGLIGYGNLIIIKHNDTYLSAYGHNRKLLVKEGTTVKQGQKIAEMGESGKQGVMLHFEIRRDGKPVDPTRYLPKQGS